MVRDTLSTIYVKGSEIEKIRNDFLDESSNHRINFLGCDYLIDSIEHIKGDLLGVIRCRPIDFNDNPA